MGGIVSQSATPAQRSQPRPSLYSPLPPIRSTATTTAAPFQSYFLPFKPSPELTHTHSRTPGPASIDAIINLLSSKGLPIELSTRIVEDAKIWSKCTRQASKSCTVLSLMNPPRRAKGDQWERWTSAQEDELRKELDVEDSGLRDKKGEVWYLCSSPIGCGPGCRVWASDVGRTEGEYEDEGRRLFVREIIVQMYSRDQGWSDDAASYGTYENSYSWFEISLLREGREVPSSRMKIQYNMHAGQYFKSHHRVLGRDHKFTKMAREGDRVVLWARAEFPGWTNHVKEASITILTAPFPYG